MSQSDRKLLEMAAKAAGGFIPGWGAGNTPHYPFEKGRQLFWHPARESGDCMALAEKLGMRIDFKNQIVECEWLEEDGERRFTANCWGGSLGTVGDAVLRTAAEIGESMQ